MFANDIGYHKVTRLGNKIDLMYGDGCDLASHCQDCPLSDCYAQPQDGKWLVPQYIKRDPGYRSP